MTSLLPLSHSMTVLVAIGLVAAIIIITCVIAFIVYKIRFVQLENESQKSVVDGGDNTEMSDLFSERYKNEGSVGLRHDDLL